MLTVPDSIKRTALNRLTSLGAAGFSRLMREVLERMRPALNNCEGMEPRVMLGQRHWNARSSPAICDAALYFDLRTAFVVEGSKLKFQPQWLDAAFACLANKNSNMEFQVGAYFPFQRCAATRTIEILDRMAEAWIACRPLIDLLADDVGVKAKNA